MKEIMRHKLTATMFVFAVLMVSCTIIAVDAYPVPVAVLWVAFTVTLGFAVVAIRRDIKHG
ncbi:hypothetical protein [Glutamicibacter halophytocola]|uniref:Lipoprotein n=1 Tax=Glutamicibacter halophytocola TaxID=1933880 RepID=A0AA95BTB3_9MICC|nr:hypothetical protein [Glutamicibacter halophytocola]UUX60192.1 hypothetical protein NUH22_06150 [Glutamicibacter halophytocola]